MKLEELTQMEVGPEKPEEDYSAEVDEKLLSLKKLDPKTNFNQIFDELSQLEKKTRVSGDAVSTAKVLKAIVKICVAAEKWNNLNENIIIFVKKRSQLKLSIVEMIREAMSVIDQTPNKEYKLKLIETLRTATEGKIFVENERARICKILATIKENDGDIAAASKILEEVQVDTFGTMEKREKVEFILEQMRLLITNEDFIKAQIVAKKINTKFFNEKEYLDLKYKYYNLMIQMDKDHSFIKTSKHYQAMMDTEDEALDKNEKTRMFICAILYCILSPLDNEQCDMIARLSKNKMLDDLPLYKQLLDLFLSNELIDWNLLNENYKQELLTLPIFDSSTKHGVKCWTQLRNRVIEYNIKTISTSYTKIYLSRLSELILLNEAESETHLSNLIVNGTINAKIDRPSGIVNFFIQKEAIERLNQWSNGLKHLMGSIEKTSHLIEKEECIQKAMFF